MVDASPGKSAFVTGGTGFVGSHLVEALLARGYTDVRSLVRRRPKWLAGLDVEHIGGDLDDETALREGVRGVEYVYHVAGVTGTKERLSWDEFYAANVAATERLLRIVEEEAPEVRAVLVTSSLAAVGSGTQGIADESAPLAPVSLYGRSKAEMEDRVRTFADRLPVVIVRPPAVYGPREADIYQFFQAIDRGLCPIVGSEDEPALSLVHVRDLVDGMIRAAESRAALGGTFFLSSARPYAWGEVRDAAAEAVGRRVFTLTIPEALVLPVGALVEAAGRLVGRHTPLNREKAREIRYACTMCTSERAREAFGYHPSVPLDAGVQETIAWYRANDWL